LSIDFTAFRKKVRNHNPPGGGILAPELLGAASWSSISENGKQWFHYHSFYIASILHYTKILSKEFLAVPLRGSSFHRLPGLNLPKLAYDGNKFHGPSSCLCALVAELFS
jgi:hypothetical protein